MMMSKGIRPWRRLVEALQGMTILGLPFLKIRGESALRFDIPNLRLHFFGINLWIEELFLVLIALIFLTFLVILITLLFGRVWCGWICPQTVIVDYTRFVDRASKKGAAYRTISFAAAFGISVVVTASLIWYFVSPYEFMRELLSQSLSPITWGFWIVLTVILFLNFVFLRHRLCATVCPYAKLQSVLYDSGTLLIAFDPSRKEECINCMACVKTCPVGIDIRQGMNSACINCAECVDACTKVMSRKVKPSLIGYSFGLPGEGARVFRQNAILIGFLTVASLFFLLSLSFSRTALDMTVLPNYDFPPRITDDGRTVNSYLLSIENRGKRDLEVAVRVSGKVNNLKIIPERFFIRAGEYKRIPAYVSAKSIGVKSPIDVELIIEPIRHEERKEEMKLTRKAHFIIPGA